MGGFAIGLVAATWTGPFKSLARSDQCAGAYHSSGALFRNRQSATSKAGAQSGSASSARIESAAALPTYDASDVIGVLWRENGDVAFFKNGVEVGAIPAAEGGTKKCNSTGGKNVGSTGDVEGRSSKSTKAKGKFVLACQPYMGGVARIKRATHGFPSSFQASIKF